MAKCRSNSKEKRKRLPRRESHQSQVEWVPCAHDVPSGVRVPFDSFDQLTQLVHSLSRVVPVHVGVLGAEVPPLEAIDWAKISFFSFFETQLVQELSTPVSVPNSDSFGFEFIGVGAASNEPKQFFQNALPINSLCRQKRKRVLNVKLEHFPKEANSADVGSVFSELALLNDFSDQVEVLELVVSTFSERREETEQFLGLSVPAWVTLRVSPLIKDKVKWNRVLRVSPAYVDWREVCWELRDLGIKFRMVRMAFWERDPSVKDGLAVWVFECLVIKRSSSDHEDSSGFC